MLLPNPPNSLHHSFRCATILPITNTITALTFVSDFSAFRLVYNDFLYKVVEELWEHYLKFHLKDTDQGGVIVTDGSVKELVGEEYVEYRYQDDGQECIVVSEGDLVAGEDIHTAAEEVTA